VNENAFSCESWHPLCRLDNGCRHRTCEKVHAEAQTSYFCKRDFFLCTTFSTSITATMEDATVAHNRSTSEQSGDCSPSNATTCTTAAVYTAITDATFPLSVPAPGNAGLKNPRASLLGLPTELFQNIAAYASDDELLALRSVCKDAREKERRIFI
jgi:hypothetical protein